MAWYLALLTCIVSFIVTECAAYIQVPKNDRSTCDFDFNLAISKDGSYKVLVGGSAWFYSGETWFQINGTRCSIQNGCLKLVSYDKNVGEDSMGPYDVHQMTYLSKSGYTFILFFLLYKDKPIILFGQNYVNETEGTTVGDDTKTASGFPSFDLSKTSIELGYFAPRGYFSGWDDRVFGRWKASKVDLNDGQNIGPMVVFDKKNHAVVMSPFMEFMAASQYYDSNTTTLHIGPLGRANKVPANFLLWTIMYHSCGGMNKAYRGWGESLQLFYKSKSKDFSKTDLTNNYLGYWTDNGAYYYYNTESNKTYEQTILDVVRYLRGENIPVRYMQYDSWWYPKDKNGGLLEWTSVPSIFPHGMTYMMKTTGMAASSHSKWWSPKTPLAKQNGGKYEFIIEEKMALPVDPKFFQDIVASSRNWGNVMYNQDWLGQMYNGLDVLRTDLQIGKHYMFWLNQACLDNGVTLELCTAYPRHTMAALETNSATINRVSYDYNPDTENWRIGETSLYVSALGQTPFKDSFWTTSQQDCPKYPGKKEPYPALQSVVASLSAGPVAFSDGIYKTDKFLLLRCCNERGEILKPSIPATSIDAVFHQKAFVDGSGPVGEVWTTYSRIGPFTYGIIFAADLNGSYIITPKAAAFSDWMKDYDYVVFPYDNVQNTQPFSNMSSLKLSNCTKAHFCLYYVSPVFAMGGKKIILYGELSKWIAVSPRRVSDVTLFSGDLQVTLRGAPNEVVTTTVSIDGKIANIKCSLRPSGMTLLSALGANCA